MDLQRLQDHKHQRSLLCNQVQTKFLLKCYAKTEALQKLALSGSGSEVSRNLECKQDFEES